VIIKTLIPNNENAPIVKCSNVLIDVLDMFVELSFLKKGNNELSMFSSTFTHYLTRIKHRNVLFNVLEPNQRKMGQ